MSWSILRRLAFFFGGPRLPRCCSLATPSPSSFLTLLGKDCRPLLCSVEAAPLLLPTSIPPIVPIAEEEGAEEAEDEDAVPPTPEGDLERERHLR